LLYGDAGDKIWAAQVLGERRDRDAGPALVQCLNDKTPCVISWAAWALGEIGDRAAVRPLLRCLLRYDAAFRSAREGMDPKYEVDVSMALEKLTGKKYGLDVVKWQLWLITTDGLLP
jgi:hypothetical protein